MNSGGLVQRYYRTDLMAPEVQRFIGRAIRVVPSWIPISHRNDFLVGWWELHKRGYMTGRYRRELEGVQKYVEGFRQRVGTVSIHWVPPEDARVALLAVNRVWGAICAGPRYAMQFLCGAEAVRGFRQTRNLDRSGTGEKERQVLAAFDALVKKTNKPKPRGYRKVIAREVLCSEGYVYKVIKKFGRLP